MLNNDELVVIVGGATISGTIINAIVRAGNLLLEVGRSLGTAIRMARSRKSCSI